MYELGCNVCRGWVGVCVSWVGCNVCRGWVGVCVVGGWVKVVSGENFE